MDGLLTPTQQFQILDAVWLGSTAPEAFEEVGLDFQKLHPFLPVDFCRFLVEVAMVARARDAGIGFIPGRGFES